MKYTVKVEGEAALGLPEQDFKLEAKDGDAAVDAVRDKLSKLLPKEGGTLDVVVSCEEAWTRESPTLRGGTLLETFPPGEVSSFSFHVEPHESVRKQVAARKADAELTTLQGIERFKRRTQLLASLKQEGTLTDEQFFAAVENHEQTLESVVADAVSGKVEVRQ